MAMAYKNIVIDIPFNIDLSGYMLPVNYIHFKLKRNFKMTQTEEWIERRIALFMKYTAQSLIHQTDQNFTCLIRCTTSTLPIINEKLKAYPPLPSHIQFTDQAQNIIDRSMKEHKQLCRVVIDSDNMFHPAAISEIQHYQAKNETQSLVFQEGYAYDESTRDVIRIYHPSPSFYAVLYNEETYKLYYQKRLFEKHWDAVKYPFEPLKGARFCICIHELNVDNTFRSLKYGYLSKPLSEQEKADFLREWNLT